MEDLGHAPWLSWFLDRSDNAPRPGLPLLFLWNFTNNPKSHTSEYRHTIILSAVMEDRVTRIRLLQQLTRQCAPFRGSDPVRDRFCFGVRELVS